MHEYDVVMLGPRGSGKTVFLASMYNRMSVQGSRGFYLYVDDRQRPLLVKAYRTIAYGAEWPPGTMFNEVTEWVFSCCVSSLDGSKTYTPFRMRYLDYSGARLTDEALYDEAFSGRIRKADCLLALLDGAKILDILLGRSDGEFEIDDLQNMLALIQSCNVPVQFVISKWDLLEPSFTLGQVRQALLSIRVFREFVEGISNGRAIRLIPVSSVGSGFAVRGADGAMVKKSGAAPTPFQVELPFACVLPDRLHAHMEQLAQQTDQIRALEQAVTSDVRLSLRERLGKAFSAGIGVMRDLLPDHYRFTDGLLKKAAESLSAPAARREADAARTAEQRRSVLQGSMAQVTDERTALEHAMNSFLELIGDLEYRWPESRIATQGSYSASVAQFPRRAQ